MQSLNVFPLLNLQMFQLLKRYSSGRQYEFTDREGNIFHPVKFVNPTGKHLVPNLNT